MPEDALHARLDVLEADNARLRRLLDQDDVGAELRHQTRNTFAVVRTIIRRSAETSVSVEDYAAHLDGRLDAIVRVQNTILHQRAGVDLHALIAEELRVVGAQEGRQAQLSGPRLGLRPKAAEIFALACHELATNAVKFGALAKRVGLVSVLWHVDAQDSGDPALTLIWQETSTNDHDGILKRRGFGHEVLERMMQFELRADTSLELLPAGLRCEIRLPLSPRVGVLLGERGDGTLEKASG